MHHLQDSASNLGDRGERHWLGSSLACQLIVTCHNDPVRCRNYRRRGQPHRVQACRLLEEHRLLGCHVELGTVSDQM
jgi:hypothetical protein